MVQNAVERAAGGTNVTLELIYCAEHRLRIALADESAQHPILRQPDRRSPRGRGMHLMTTAADRWGCEKHPGGKKVWFEIDLSNDPG